MNHALLCGSTSLEIGTSKCYHDQGWHHTNSQSLTQRRERRGQRRVGHASSLPGRRFNEDSDEQATPPLSRAGAWTTTGGRNSDKQLGRLPAEQRRRHGKAPLDGVASTTARLRRLCTACCAIEAETPVTPFHTEDSDERAQRNEAGTSTTCFCCSCSVTNGNSI